MNSVSKNVYIHKLDYIDNTYNNTYHSTIKMRPIDKELSTYTVFGIDNNEKKTLNLVTMQEYQDIKHFCKRLYSKLVWSFFDQKS